MFINFYKDMLINPDSLGENGFDGYFEYSFVYEEDTS